LGEFTPWVIYSVNWRNNNPAKGEFSPRFAFHYPAIGSDSTFIGISKIEHPDFPHSVLLERGHPGFAATGLPVSPSWIYVRDMKQAPHDVKVFRRGGGRPIVKGKLGRQYQEAVERQLTELGRAKASGEPY
jgi:hypothetical protein